MPPDHGTVEDPFARLNVQQRILEYRLNQEIHITCFRCESKAAIRLPQKDARPDWAIFHSVSRACNSVAVVLAI